jgi:hypothetical protein
MIVGDFYVIDAMFRSSTLVNSLFQATPQIVIQVYNNQQIKNWNFLTIISIGVAGLSLIYTLTKLAYAIDKVKQYENACCITDRKNTGNKINIEITEHQRIIWLLLIIIKSVMLILKMRFMMKTTNLIIL